MLYNAALPDFLRSNLDLVDYVAVIPDTLYAWQAGDDGAVWIEIHAGEPGIFTDRA